LSTANCGAKFVEDVGGFELSNMKQELVGQERYYTRSGQVWWYCKEFELDRK
jgi:hypothetical protein